MTSASYINEFAGRIFINMGKCYIKKEDAFIEMSSH